MEITRILHYETEATYHPQESPKNYIKYEERTPFNYSMYWQRGCPY